MAKCSSYFQHGMKFRCYSTEKMDECSCGGDESKCEFFPEKKKPKIPTERERLLQILNVPIHPHLDVDPLEAVADYLLDSGVKVPVLCKDCKWYKEGELFPEVKFCFRLRHPSEDRHIGYNFSDEDYCSRGERKDND